MMMMNIEIIIIVIYFIISVLHQQPEGQLQTQQKRTNEKDKKITTANYQGIT
jgi:energy-converting hydrogenase Eha subunit H